MGRLFFRVPRFYISPDSWNLDRLCLGGAEAHHCLDVLRLKAGDRVTVFNGLGVEATAEISGGTRECVELKRLRHTKSPALPCSIALGQAVPKGKNMELIVEKATELGAASIIPILSDRTIVQCDAEEARRKQEKWQRVAVEAAKQCGQNWLPTVDLPQSPKAFFEARPNFDLMLIGSLQSDARHLKQVLADYQAADQSAGARGPSKPVRPSRVLILIGPEGDFTPAEVALAKSHGCRAITLGPIILRTETAAIYCLSVLSHELLNV